MTKLEACHRCLAGRAKPNADGVLSCPEDGRDIIAHAREGACPLGKFVGTSFPPPAPIPDDYDPEHERRRLRAGGCCGRPSNQE